MIHRELVSPTFLHILYSLFNLLHWQLHLKIYHELSVLVPHWSTYEKERF